MNSTNPEVQALLAQPRWHDERKALRAELLDCGLDEAVKWGQLCYMHAGGNVAIFFGLKDYCGVGFFKGTLLQDPDGLLSRQGEHSQAMRLFRFTTVDEISRGEAALRGFVRQAVAVEKAGLKIDFKEKHELVFPPELVDRFDADPDFRAAFQALTPGRQRAYTLHFSGAKQSATRSARIEKHVARILAGKGMADR